MILIDAFAYNYLSDKYTSFIYKISNDNTLLRLNPILGYSDSIRATIFTGAYPEDHRYWMFYKFSPETSPFKGLTRLKFIENFPELIKRPMKIAISLTYCKYLSKKFGYSNLSVQNFLLNTVEYFDFTLKENMLTPNVFGDYRTIFDILSENNIKWQYINSTNPIYLLRSPSSQRKYLLSKIRDINEETDFIFIYLHHPDILAHRFGINSKRFKNVLKETDILVKDLYEELIRRFKEISVIIFSDHGMADAQKFINFNDIFKEKGFGKDYLIALDSTMVRIWYLKEKGYKIREYFENLNYGRFLSKNELKDLKIKFDNRWYFDDIYLIEPPYNIYPNFTSLLKPYAMHAYHPDLESQKGIAIFYNMDVRKKNEVELVDFMPTVLDYFGISKPNNLRGESLLK